MQKKRIYIRDIIFSIYNCRIAEIHLYIVVDNHLNI